MIFLWTTTSAVELLGRYVAGLIYHSLGYSVITDRGILDLSLKYSDSSRIALRRFSRFLLVFELKRNQHSFLLVCDSGTAQVRDGSLSEVDIERRMARYLDFLGSEMMHIDTGFRTPDEVAQLVLTMTIRES